MIGVIMRIPQRKHSMIHFLIVILSQTNSTLKGGGGGDIGLRHDDDHIPFILTHLAYRANGNKL